MPQEDAWAEFFDADAAMGLLWPDASGDVVELGSGYGTFTVAAARRTTGRVNALDIEPEMVAYTQDKALALGLANVHATLRDIVAEGLGLPTASQAHAMVCCTWRSPSPCCVSSMVVFVRMARYP